MTTDPAFPLPKRRWFSRFDGAVLVVTLAALAAPFGLRWMDNAEAFAPQVAQRGHVESFSPLDSESQRAEAAFFEGLDQTSPDALDIALAAPIEEAPVAPRAVAPVVVEEQTAEAVAQPERAPVTYTPPPRTEPEAVFQDDIQTAKLVAPSPVLEVAVPRAPVIEDTAPIADTADTPPVPDEAVEPEIRHVRVEVTVPPRVSPLPRIRPRSDEPAESAVASLEPLSLPIDVTPQLPTAPSAVEIEEQPLPPLSAEPQVVQITQPKPEATVVAMADTGGDTETASDAPAAVTVKPLPTTPKPATAARAPEKPAQATSGPRITNGPRIALVIAAAGLNSNVTRFAIEALPEGVTLAFAPVKVEARQLAREAKENGHTVLVEIPMEPISKARDPGPLTLRVGDPVKQNLDRLNEALTRIPVADGASSYLGARFNAVEGAAAPIMAALAKRNLFFFENEPTARSVLGTLARRQGMSYAQGVVKFDKDRSGAAIRAALDALEKQARKKGSAVGVGTALRGTISTVALWAKEAEKRGVRFVPITEIGR